MQCHFCYEDSTGACVWPVERFVETEADQLKIGDVVRRYDESKKQHWSVATVESVERLGSQLIRVSLSIRTKTWSVRGKVFEANDFSRCRVLTKEPCGIPACEAHMVCRWPGHYLCMEHWNAWEMAA